MLSEIHDEMGYRMQKPSEETGKEGREKSQHDAADAVDRQRHEGAAEVLTRDHAGEIGPVYDHSRVNHEQLNHEAGNKTGEQMIFPLRHEQRQQQGQEQTEACADQRRPFAEKKSVKKRNKLTTDLVVAPWNIRIEPLILE